MSDEKIIKGNKELMTKTQKNFVESLIRRDRVGVPGGYPDPTKFLQSVKVVEMKEKQIMKWLETGFYTCPKCKSVYTQKKFCLNHNNDIGYPVTKKHKIKILGGLN